MRLTNALAQIKGGNAAEKTAASTPVAAPLGTPPSSSDAAREVLATAIKEATAPESVTKTASQTSPVEDLAKLAADVSAAEHEATTKEAMSYGAAVADGFVARLAQYQDASAKLAAQGVVPAPIASPAVKTAAVDGGFEKFATENPQIVREAYDLGYTQTQAQLTKLAEAAYVQGYNGTVEKIYKLACDTFVGGFSDTLKLLEAAPR